MDGETWRNNFDNIDFRSEDISTEEAIDILGLTDEDFLPADEQLTVGYPVTDEDMQASLKYVQAIEEGKKTSEWLITPPAV